MAWKNCRYCNCSFKDGKGVKKNGKAHGILYYVIMIFTFGFGLSFMPTLQCYCSRQCWAADNNA